MTELRDHELTEVEQALVDSIKTVLECCLALNPSVSKPLIESFEHQRDGNLRKQQPKAAAVFEMLRRRLADPTREKERQRAQQFLKNPPAGSA
jgi:hypothetical protein